MSLQQDYLLKMIEMMGDLIAALLGKIKKGETLIAEEQIQQYYDDFLKRDAGFFRSLPIENLTQTLIREHDYTNEHLQILAELFFTEGELQIAKGNLNDANEYLQKTLKLWEYIEKNSITFDLNRQRRIENIKMKIVKITKAEALKKPD